MKKSLAFLLLAGTLPAACNNKSPEQGPQTTAAAPVEAPVHAGEAAVSPELPPAAPPRDPAALDGDAFVAYDLLANRPHAHGLSGPGGAAVEGDGGAASFLRYIQGNHGNEWVTGIEVDGRRASALRKTRNATLWVPAPVVGDATFVAEVYNPAAQPNKLTLKAGGKDLGSASVAPGWQTVEIAIAADAMRAEMALTLDFASMGRIEGNLSGGAIGKFRLGAKSDRALDSVRDVAAAQGALTVGPAAGGAMWHLWAIDPSRLRVQTNAPPDCAAEVVWWNERGGALNELGRKPVAAGETWVDLGTKDELVRVAVVPQADSCAQGVELTSAALVVPGAQPAVPQGKPPKHVLFWMIDTLRSDHLPIHFETDVQAPNLKRLASEGASFAVSYVQGNESRTSHASLFSGLYPSAHKVLARGHLKPHHHLLPEAMGDNGYKAYAFISNGYVSEPWGFVQGWDMYRNNLRSGFAIHAEGMAGHTLEWMTKHKDQRMLMYVGTIDPHVTYRKHDDLIGLYDDPDYRGRYANSMLGTTLGEVAAGKVQLTDREKKRVVALYKNEITYNDRAFGSVRKALEELGTWDETMVVITGDHGEQFWERGGVGHGSGVHQEQVHVPLILYYPPLIPAGTVVEAGADVLDIYPTILDAIDATKIPGDLQGHSLLNHVHRTRADYPEPAIATSYLSRYGVQMRQWKMVSKNGAYELYNRSVDPLEMQDVAGKHPLAERWLADTFSAFRPLRDKWKKAEFGPASNLAPDFLDKVAQLPKD